MPRTILTLAFVLLAGAAAADSTNQDDTYRQDLEFLAEFVSANSAALQRAEDASEAELRDIAEISARNFIAQQGCAVVWPNKTVKESRRIDRELGQASRIADLAALGIDPLAGDLSDSRRGRYSDTELPKGRGHDLKFVIEWLSKNGAPPEIAAFEDFDDRLFGCVDCSGRTGVIDKTGEISTQLVKDGFLIVEEVQGGTKVTLSEACTPF